MGCGLSWAVRRRLEASCEAGADRVHRAGDNEHHGGGKLRVTQTYAED
jgi:hypothetical protein